MIVYDNDISSPKPGVIQFENANEGRSYPFADNAILKSDDGKDLGENVISDMHLSIPKSCNAYLSSVYISDSLVSVCVRVVDVMNNVSAMSCIIKGSDFEPYRPYALEKLSGSEDIGGVVTFGAIDFISEKGSYKFSNNLIEIADSAVSKYTPAKLRKIIDDRTGEYVSGDIDLEFSSYIKATKENGGIKLELMPGANDALLSKCDKNVVENPCFADPVKTINGVAPDSKNRIVIWFH